MASAVNEPASAATRYLPTGRAARIARAAVLLVAGFAIAFSASVHSLLEFDRWILAGSLVLVTVVIAAEAFAARGQRNAAELWVRAGVALAAAVGVIVAPGVVGVAIVLAVWAAVEAVIALVGLVRKTQPRDAAIPAAVFNAGIAVALLLVREDPVAVIGFFGVFAVITGVFLGISCFDGHRTEPSERGAERSSGATALPITTIEGVQ